MDSIRIMIVDDHTVVRDGLAAMIEREDDFEVVGRASNGREAVERAPALQPQVVLMDLRMPEMDGVEAMRQIGAADEGVQFIVLTTYDTDEYIFDAIDAGAKGFLLKDASREELFRAIRAVAEGQSLIEPGVAARVLERLSQLSRQEQPAALLSDRESQVLQEMARGSANKQIAVELSISESTVKTHVANIFQKLEAGGRTEAVTKALQMGLIKL